MTKIQLDDDVIEYLRSQLEFGETASDVLRRLLSIGSKMSARKTASGRFPTKESRPAPPDDGVDPDALLDFVASEPFLSLGSVTERYLAVLGFVHEESPERFVGILKLSGRSRRYFGRSREEIEQSGRSTGPERIPHSEYWALTNMNSDDKREMLRLVLQSHGYRSAIIARVTRALG